MDIISGKPIRILIVEDEPSICDICQLVLEPAGLEVDIAENGRVAKSLVANNSYDTFLIDIRMPEINGKELYQWLEENHPDMAKTVIFTTGDVIGGETKDFLDESARPILPKPFTPTELENIVIETIKELKSKV